MKAKEDCLFCSSAKFCKGFSKIDNSVKPFLQKWIIYHPHVIQSPIAKYYITIRFDDGVRGVKIKLCQKVILQVSILELHIDMIKKMMLGFHGIQ